MPEKKKLPPMLDWLISVVIVILVIGGILYVLTNKGVADNIAQKIFTWQGGVAFVVVFLIVGSIREGIQRKKISKIKNEIQEKMSEDWGRTR